MFGWLKRNNKVKHPYHDLNLGLIKEYSMIVPKAELGKWTGKGWIEDRTFMDFHYAPGKGEAMILSRPRSLKEIEIGSLLNSRVVDFTSQLGSYGMGGPGFFGVLLDQEGSQQYLVYAVWHSGQYIMMEGRVITCHLKYNRTYKPWVSEWAGESAEEQWDQLSGVIKGSVITGITLCDAELHLELSADNSIHELIFYQYNEALPPLGNGEARKQAFQQGVIGDYIILSEKNAVLHV
ncbi:hypothetical protein PAECIP111892_01421 [Paenibacillus auburnensis]|uniref:Uncharacterized protein n=1 Tax=Paenibacillus auburnensis TaxID=2905649 RepID=A0ABM9BSJ5_9BACL|nr:hypothetical protein [Paenibacillus auburnensis]CAH1194132.1 hypothetical protein PAECIP111892_01421 [Paenibacillus auburnensis]